MDNPTIEDVFEMIEAILEVLESAGVDYREDLIYALVSYIPPEVFADALTRFAEGLTDDERLFVDTDTIVH
tara:strand:- start:880 stop:1092 length:213 start_codon:yes stop_codon:yes gene_type:complete